MAQNIPDGKYTAIPESAAVYEKNEKLVLETRFTLADQTGTAYKPKISRSKKYWLTNKMGALNTKTIDQIKKWAPAWDGLDPYWFTEGTNFADCGAVEIVIKTSPYTNSNGETVNWQDIEWVNPIDGGASAPIASADKASIMAKYGAMFKAASASTPKPVSLSALPSRPAAAPSRPAPAARPASTAKHANGLQGQGVVWDEYCASLEANVTSAERDDKWFATLDKVAPGKDQADMTGEEWDKVADELDLPPF